MLRTREACVCTVREVPIPISSTRRSRIRAMSRQGTCVCLGVRVSMRAIRCRYDPFIQVRTRVEQLKHLGHSVDKVEFIVMGGTFLSLDQTYQDEFIMRLHDALSGHHSHSVEEAVKWDHRLTKTQVQRAKCVEMRGDHDRNASGLLSKAAPEQHAALRLHAYRDRCAERVRSRLLFHLRHRISRAIRIAVTPLPPFVARSSSRR